MKQVVHLGEFAREALTGGKEGAEVVLTTSLVSAIRVYLSDRDSDHPGWPYPGFLPPREGIDEVKLELDVEDDLWRVFEEEAGRQEISVSRLASHAALYYAAELNAGRLTQRIVNGVEDEGA
jgi:hypothetical protein